MKFLATISKVIDKIVAAIASVASYLVLVILAVVVYEVIMRRFLSSPTLWAYEMASFLFGAYIMLVIPYGIQLGVNVSVDVFYNRFNDRMKNILDENCNNKLNTFCK